MKPELIIEGIECEKCSGTIEKKIISNSTVGKVFNSLHKKIVFVHRQKSSSQLDFLTSLSDTPYLLGRVIESIDCHCCKEIRYNFQLG